MLDMGFIHDIKKVLALVPKQKQTLLFSATFSDEIRELANGLLRNPVSIQVTPRNTTVQRITQTIHPVGRAKKKALLTHIMRVGKKNPAWMIGGIAEMQEMLNFCGQHNIVSDVEVIKAEYINQAYDRTVASDVKYRFVIDATTF
jgi:superfamily II DNA/RNA helicase